MCVVSDRVACFSVHASSSIVVVGLCRIVGVLCILPLGVSRHLGYLCARMSNGPFEKNAGELPSAPN